jgi:hypothetical protein
MRNSFAFLIMLLVVPVISQAQWASDSVTNTPVCTAAGLQDYPRICPDGQNGAFVVWEDLRAGTYRVYAQHLNAAGVATWTANGIQVCTTTTSQQMPVVASDGHGGAYVVWQDARNQSVRGIDLFAQHITSSGSRAFADTGAPVCTANGDQTNANIISDGFGNAFVTWEDNRAALSLRPDLYINRISSAGVNWLDGNSMSSQNGRQQHAQLAADGTGGCFAVWESTEGNPSGIYAQHIDSSGTFRWTSGAGGLNIYQGPSSVQNSSHPSLCVDGSTLLVAWEVTNATQSNGQDIYAQRITSNGNKVYYNALAVTGDWFGDQTYPQIYSDDSTISGVYPYHGMIVIFKNDYSFTEPALSTVRLLADGVTRFPDYNNGFFEVAHQGVGSFATLPVATGDTHTGAFAVWVDARNDSSIYAQRVDRVDRRYLFPPGYSSGSWGEALSARPSSVAREVAICPRTNGLIAVWTDYRSGNADIYAQLLFMDGSLPIELSNFQVTSPREGEVDLAWQTASEHSCAGFEVQRRAIGDGFDNTYSVIGSYANDAQLRGAGTSSLAHYYAFRDYGVEPDVYEYRLIDIATDGTRHVHPAERIDASRSTDPGRWTVGTNEPNPFIETTEIPLTLASDAMLDVTVSDVMGRTVAVPMGHEFMSAGTHEIKLDARMIGSLSGTYFVRISANDPTTGLTLWHSNKPIMISLLR